MEDNISLEKEHGKCTFILFEFHSWLIEIEHYVMIIRKKHKSLSGIFTYTESGKKKKKEIRKSLFSFDCLKWNGNFPLKIYGKLFHYRNSQDEVYEYVWSTFLINHDTETI